MNEQSKNPLQPNLIPYVVSLHEDAGDKFIMHFECMAEDDDHAIEQAENAYPNCEILSWLPSVESGPYIIYSANEAATNDGAGFWSNTEGWVEEEQATMFTVLDRIDTDFMPMCVGQDAVWQVVPTAEITAEIKVQYVLNGHSPESMRLRLKDEIAAEVDRGILSGDTSATVEDYQITVSIQDRPEKSEMDESLITMFLSRRIEDGNLSLEDIPKLMARYGMMEPKQFIDEMNERMNLSETD